MSDIVHFPLFVASVVLLCITPGPDLAYVVGQSVARGRRAGILSAAGVALGSCTHAVASALGLTALIAASPLLFTLIKYLGAAYLIYLGARMIGSTFIASAAAETAPPPRALTGTRLLLLRGFITSITNPKVLLFFIAFFPQFVVIGSQYHASAFLLLGMTYALIGLMTDVMFALLAGGAAGAVANNKRLQKVLDRLVGATFIGLGIRLALTRR
ncbi:MULTISPECIES: LysE family translocator [Pantoea]|jgi:RhtB (resistance to homoserine/threonine) family protein|uniref:LysE family translocator n=1 Tax=Pantoea brenneri TaxID=472694 RepID=A0A7Y6NB59_9GAMM|nr:MULTISPECIES: LysE family translocator [Pantoea]MBZ6393626.1 LysE family translocator [Pantoea sp.]MBZ6437391.1 LysE family translocator [Pantoea sp.]NUY40355.1 LysE family translocator [Pantoea brenneri]NUY47561.1 LysE family translocator [Pantoea brenneri]NUY57888.1 LysE family translocator [Pantoea brenneri]